MTRAIRRKRRRRHVPRTVVHRTAWHPILADVLSVVLPPERGYQVLSELQLSYQPLRVDYVIIRKDPLAQPASPVLAPLTRLLGPINLVELTGPTSVLEADDFRWTLIYATAVCIRLQIDDHRDLRVFVVASRLTDGFLRRAQQYGGTIHTTEPGVHEIRGLAHVLYGIETEVAGDHILRLLSPQFLKDPGGLFALLNEEERAIFWRVYDRIEQFKKDRETAHKYPDWKDIEMTADELEEQFMEKFLSRLPPDRLLSRLRPEERLRGLSLEERLKGLSPEDLKGLSPEDLKDLSPEVRETLKKLFK